ncbi:MAG: hypothetical protein IJ165_00940 [Proteobacteria bacterium]|nr:hypothetical protein [Pseudomonadota bacterium]
MAQRIKLATNLIAMEELIHATGNAISEMVPDKYIYHQRETPDEYQYIMNALSKIYEASQEIRKAKKIIKPEIKNDNIRNKL